MGPTCSMRGCESPAVPGAPLCAEHLEQVDAAHGAAAEAARSLDPASRDPYDLMVERYASAIGASDQMRGLALALVAGGVRDASESFPELKSVPQSCIEQLASFLAVSVVSAVIQERAHLLARAMMLAGALPPEQAAGIHKAVDEELEAVKPRDKEEEA